MYRAFVIAALTIPAAACASAQAGTPVEPVSLEVPVVPPRLVETVVIDPPPAPPVEEPALPPAPAPTTRVRPNRDPNRGEPRPDPKQPEPEPEPSSTTPVTPPVPPLRTGTPSASSSTDETKRQVMEIVARARGMLDGINTQGMSEDRLANYESAKDSIQRAEAALKTSNLVFARQSAERAENIAKLLISR